jgi:hypothetical protein
MNASPVHSLRSERDDDEEEERIRCFLLDVIVRLTDLRKRMTNDLFKAKPISTGHVESLDGILLECKTYVTSLGESGGEKEH